MKAASTLLHLSAFFAGAAVGLTAAAVVMDLFANAPPARVLELIAVFAGTLTLGFGTALTGLGGVSFLERPGALWSVIFGLFAPLTLVAAVVALGGLPVTPGSSLGMRQLNVTSVVVGSVVGVLMLAVRGAVTRWGG